MFDFAFNQFDFLPRCLEKFSEINLKVTGAVGEQIKATQTYWNGIYDRYFSGFITPSWLALNYFCAVERDKMISIPPWESVRDYTELLQFNLRIAEKGFTGSLVAMNEYHIRQTSNAFSAWLNTIFDREGEDINEFMARQRELIEKVVYEDMSPKELLYLSNASVVKVWFFPAVMLVVSGEIRI